MFAGDPAQSLYRSYDLGEVLAGRDVTHRRLALPYRSTKPILQAAAALAGAPVDGADRAPHGEPVELIRLASRTELGNCVADRIGRLLGEGRATSDIAVLITSAAARCTGPARHSPPQTCRSRWRTAPTTSASIRLRPRSS
jgi:hypothetical protein